MKIKLLSLLFLLLTANFAFGQKTTSDAPQKNSNMIIVTTKLSDADAFKLAGKQLMKDGYKIGKSDSNFYSISTEMMYRENYDFLFGLNVSVIDGSVYIRGDARNGGYKFEPYYGKGRGIAVPVVAFGFMDTFALRLKIAAEDATLKYGEE